MPASSTARQKTLALYTLIIALVLEIVDMTIVNTALPAIKASLGPIRARRNGSWRAIRWPLPCC
jgi:hypothetical protein